MEADRRVTYSRARPDGQWGGRGARSESTRRKEQ